MPAAWIGLTVAFASALVTSTAYSLEHDAAAALPPLSPRQPLRSAKLLLTDRRWLLFADGDISAKLVGYGGVTTCPWSPVEGVFRPWPQADRETSVSYLDDELAVIAMIEVTAATLAAHPFLHGMCPDHLAVLARGASDVTFPAGHRFFADGGHAICFWLVRSGHVTVDVDVPGQGPVPIDTIGMGELMGWSWLFPPFLWAFGAVAASPVETFEFDARMVRVWCACDPALSYEVTRRVAEVLTRRMKSTRSRLITASLYPAPVRS